VQYIRPLFRSSDAPTLTYASIDRLGQVEGVADKKALAALKEAKHKLDDLYREVTSRKVSRAM
jgi:hypothetical protein